MREYLKPHRNTDAEKQLKAIIQNIQSMMYKSENHSIIEEMLKEASTYVKASDRALDLDVIEHYDAWTDLEGLVGELTMEVPVLQVDKEDFLSIVQLLREVIKTGQTPDNVRLDYCMEFYREFFARNFLSVEDTDELFDKIFEDISLDSLVEIAFPYE